MIIFVDLHGVLVGERMGFLEGAADLLSALDRVGEVMILTAAKRFEEKLPVLEALGRPYIFCTKKYLLAGPGRVLVDDDYVNVVGFGAAGGVGILYEQGKLQEVVEAIAAHAKGN